MAPTAALHAASATATTASSPTVPTRGMRSDATPPPASAATSTGRKPIRSPIQPPTGEMSAPTSAPAPATRAIELASPVVSTLTRSTRTGMYGRLICAARKAIPKIVNRRRTAGSDSTPRIAPNARSTTRPCGTTSGRTSREPRATRSAVPTDSADDTQKIADTGSPSPSTMNPPRIGPTANADRAARPEDRDHRAEPARRHDVADRRQHDPGVAELETDQEHAQRELPRLAAEGDAGEHDGLDERAPDNHRLAAVLVGPDTPERDERRTDDEDERPEDPDEPEAIRLGHAHLAQVERHEGKDLAHPEALDHRGDPEDRDDDPPVVGRRAGPRRRRGRRARVRDAGVGSGRLGLGVRDHLG